jgi:ribosomal protein S18 acetylase RimI-like enzyme
MAMLIRDFSEQDMEKLLDYREESAKISFPRMKIDREKARRFFLEHVEKYPGTLKVAELEGKIAGFIRFFPEEGSFGRYGMIDLIFVDKEHRKRGVGKLLLETAEKWFESSGISHIEAVVTNTNAPSINFFKSQGYEERRTVFNKRLNSAKSGCAG